MRAVIFDIGGVVIKDHLLKEQLFKAFAVANREEFWRLFNVVAMPACRGEESLSACWRQMATRLGLKLEEQVYQSLWVDDFREVIEVDAHVMSIVDELRGNYRLGVVSNTVEEHATILRDMSLRIVACSSTVFDTTPKR